MGLFDKLKRGKSNLTMDAIISEEYEQQYLTGMMTIPIFVILLVEN